MLKRVSTKIVGKSDSWSYKLILTEQISLVCGVNVKHIRINILDRLRKFIEVIDIFCI